jgi:hypothetical protein
VDLFPYERRRLDCLEGELRGEAPELASKFDVFTRLARGVGKPPAEGQFTADGRWRDAAFARQRLRRHLLVIACAAAVLLAAVIVLSLT